MFGGYDPNLIGATKRAKFFIQRGELWEDDEQTIILNHTLMAAVALTSEKDASGQITSTSYGDTPNGALCSLLAHLKFLLLFVVC